MTRWLCLALLGLASAGRADNLYQDPSWSAMTADRRASAIGDILTINIFQAAEATNSAQNNSRKATDLSGSISGGHLSESGELQFGGGYAGRGEVRRSERFVTQMSLTVQAVLPNGDLVVGGDQWLRINGERTRVAVKGRVRTADIASDNSVLSSRIADAEIDYDGKGFVSRSAKPGIINKIFSFLGLT
ncbi:flagellar basal body L-ring protein FlgH [Sphingomonas sp.]|uniref:flagellar basal body L-ring protein FlgH n=1 Tax=Sphingomonas sp. TaxID=28214 RepID=UPI0025E37CE8|nr:flagellar basal body L-ring protein FlgH [Sphingomonas sp.]